MTAAAIARRKARVTALERELQRQRDESQRQAAAITRHNADCLARCEQTRILGDCDSHLARGRLCPSCPSRRLIELDLPGVVE